MFLLYILDTYIILVKYLERPSLAVSINSCYMNHDAEIFRNIKYES